MFEIFVVGTFWFWALVVSEIILLFAFVNYDNGFGATISLLVFGACLQWFGQVDIIHYVSARPWAVGGALLAYFVLGLTWGIIRWYFFCLDRIRKYKELKNKFLEGKHLPLNTVMPEELRGEWDKVLDTAYAEGNYLRSRLSTPPKVGDNKNRIISWMTFWIPSMIWFFINDFVKRVFKEIYQYIHGFLQRIADNMFAHVDEDLKGAKEQRRSTGGAPPVERYRRD